MKIVNSSELNGRVVYRMAFVEDEQGLVTSVIIYFADRSAFVVTGKELGFAPNEDIAHLVNRRPTGLLPSLDEPSTPPPQPAPAADKTPPDKLPPDPAP